MANPNDKHIPLTEFISNREDSKFHVMSGGVVYLYERGRKRFAFVQAETAERASADPGEEYSTMRERAESAERALEDLREQHRALRAELDAVRNTHGRIVELIHSAEASETLSSADR